jgi:hypothetical protein
MPAEGFLLAHSRHSPGRVRRIAALQSASDVARRGQEVALTYRIIYASNATSPLQTDDLEELLDQAMRRNAAQDITGALVYSEGMFLQILEGDRQVLEDLMNQIRRDLRHERVTVLQEGEVPGRTFGQWAMAYVSATPQQVVRWAGLSAVMGTAEGSGDDTDETERTAQFAKDILALLPAR